MKFNDKYLSIPPYISTTWDNVKSLKMIGAALQVTLIDNTFVMLRDLEMDVVEAIFEAHVLYMSQRPGRSFSSKSQGENEKPGSADTSLRPSSSLEESGSGGVFPFHFGVGDKEVLGSALQHNLEYANSPDLPREVIMKITSIAKIVAPSDPQEVPQPEPHCNCPHCQIARAINEGLGNPVKPFSESASIEAGEEVEPEEEVASEDLKFQQWSIEQVGDNLFKVTNKLDISECYRVFLGSPVGCTCGQEGCEHIIAVLES